jgi:hypothetical protein
MPCCRCMRPDNQGLGDEVGMAVANMDDCVLLHNIFALHETCHQLQGHFSPFSRHCEPLVVFE